MVGSIGVGFFASPAADPALTSKQMHGLLYGGEKTALFEPFIYKMHYFTKTGGTNIGKTQKKYRFPRWVGAAAGAAYRWPAHGSFGPLSM
jgi:hypothetical protein